MSKISIIIPVYFNSDTLIPLYDEMKDTILDTLGEYEIVMVDDGSGDNSWEIMNQIRSRDKNVKCVKLSRNFGEHAAILAGLSECTGDCAITKQADLAEAPELIVEMYNKWKEGYKVVIATRAKRDDPFLKKAFANTYYKIMRASVNKNMPKGGFDCFLMDRRVIQVLELLDEKNSSLELQLLWAGFKTAEVPYHRKERDDGGSSWTLAKRIKLAMDSMMSFSYFPIKFVSSVGFIFALIAFLWIIEIFFEKFYLGVPIAGWATLMCLVLFSTGLILITLGVLGEYLWRTLDASRNRPVFIIDEIKDVQNIISDHKKNSL